MWTVAVIKDPGYYLRCVADRATAKELGLRRLAEATIVSYELENGTRLEASEVHALRRQVKVQGLRLTDGREVVLDQVEVLRDGRHVTGYRLADKTEVNKEDTQRVTLSRKRLAAYRLSDGRELARDQLRAITAGETLAGLTDAQGRPIEAAMVAIQDQMTGRVLGYYSEHGEAPGQWIGKGALEDLGLTGLVSLDENRQAYERLMAGCHPVTGEQLTEGPAVGERVSGFDHLITVPKSVSLLWGLTDDLKVREAIEAAHQESVEEALGWLESQISVARRGHASSGPGDKYPETIHHVPTTGVIAARFQHRATRPGDNDPCGDPHLHTHVTIANLAHGEDGKWNALDSALMHLRLKDASFVEQAAFRRLAVQKLAALGYHIEWTQPVNGHAEIKGLERRDWIGAFSQRSAEADAALERKKMVEEVGSGPGKARDQAGHATRRAKETGLATSELVASWQGRAAEIGLGPAQLERVLHMGKGGPVPEFALTPKLAAELAEDLTEQRNVFGLGEAIQAVANRAQWGMSVSRAVEVAKQLTHGATDQIVALRQTARTVIRRDDGRVVKVMLNDEMAECFTTKEVLRLEHQVIDIAKERRFAGVGIASAEAVTEALAAHPELGEDQVAMVAGLCSDGAGVAVALSPPGYGKTSALLPATTAWEASGHTVWATAQMAARAHELGEGVGLAPERVMTIAALRQRVEGTDTMPGTPLPKGLILEVDEVSVVDLRDLAALERHLKVAEGKLVLAGDPRQLGSIGPGAPLHELPQVAPTYELTDNRRQVEAWERKAIEALRVGRVGDAVSAYDAHGRIVYAEGESRQAKADLIQQAAQEYLSAKDRGETVALMAHTHKDRISLNGVIRAELIQRGEVEAQGMKAGDLEVAVGDALQCLKNSRPLGLDNSDLVRVEQIDPKLKTATVRRPDGEIVELSHDYLSKHAAHGYAETVHKAQGRTADVGLVLADSSSLSSQFGQVALTRGKTDNRIYFAGPRPVDPEHHLPVGQAPSKDDQWKLIAAGLTRDRSKELASQVIAALDQGDRKAAETAIAVAVEATTRTAARQAAAQTTAQAVQALAKREQQAIEAMRANEAAKTPEETEAEQRRKADFDYDEHLQQSQAHGMQRVRKL